jgi:hypothetical protein
MIVEDVLTQGVSYWCGLAAASSPRYNEQMRHLLVGLEQGLLVTGSLAATEARVGTLASSGDGGGGGEAPGDGCSVPT